MTASAPASTYVPWRFPAPLLSSYMIFTAMIWAGAVVFTFALTAFVSIWNEITMSGWLLVGQAARWFVLGAVGHLGWVMFELYLTHGRTRRAFYREALPFIGVFALCTAALYTITFPIEAGYYALFGWQHGFGEEALYASAFDLPMIALESALVFLMWGAGGFFVTTAWYRNTLLGTLAIVLGLACVVISSIALGERDGPAVLLLDILPVLSRPDGAPNMMAAIIVHLAMTAGFLALSWLWLRDTPVHGKSE